MSEIFRRHWPLTWRIDAAEAARAAGADRVVYIPGPCGGDKYGFERWAGWAELTIDADPVISPASALYTVLGLDSAYGYDLRHPTPFRAGRGLLGLDIECCFLMPGDPDPDPVIDVDRIADLLPV